MRSGAPDSLDLMVAVNYAIMAIDLIDQGAPGRMVALRNGTYTSIPIDIHPLKRLRIADAEFLLGAFAQAPRDRQRFLFALDAHQRAHLVIERADVRGFERAELGFDLRCHDFERFQRFGLAAVLDVDAGEADQ